MKIFSDVSSLAAATLTADQIVKVKSVGDYRIQDSGTGIALANGKIAVPQASGTAISVKQFGAVGDGTADDTAALQAALDSGYVAYLPKGTYRTTSTISVGIRGRALIGDPIQREQGQGYSKILFDGAASSTTAVIRMGANAVGAEPLIDSSTNVLKNVYVDANNKAGFGVYGTYMTNESLVDSVTVTSSTEFNFYFARSWYATYRNLVSLVCRGNGIALGMPLILQDGTDYSGSWVTASPLEMNQAIIDNIRSFRAGTYYATDNPSTYDPTNTSHRMKGYGIGAGTGNGFTLTNFTSERSGGVGLYVYSSGEVRKTVQYGYLEGNCENSGLVVTSTLPQIILENTTNANGIEIRDIYSKYEDGGIYHTGSTVGSTWLRNIHQPRFLKSLDGLTDNQLYGFVLKDNVYFDCGFNNVREDLMKPTGYGSIVMSTGGAGIDFPPTVGRTAIYARDESGGASGSYFKIFEDGTVVGPVTLTGLSSSWTLYEVTSPDIRRIARNSGSGTVQFKVMSVPTTFE